jgi:hypothetical protein
MIKWFIILLFYLLGFVLALRFMIRQNRAYDLPVDQNEKLLMGILASLSWIAWVGLYMGEMNQNKEKDENKGT